MSQMRVYRMIFLFLLIGFVVLIGGWKAFCFKKKWSIRPALPVSVTEFRDYISVGYSGSIYCLKARMTFDEFQEYWKDNGYIPIKAEIVEQFAWNIYGFPSWWDPTYSQYVNSYCTSDSVPRSFRAVKYENGSMYFLDWREYLW
jgi:hypothetical protein